jgi:hypothetical protein
VGRAISLFNDKKDSVSAGLASDVLDILRGRLSGLFSEKADLRVQYSEGEKKKFKNELFMNGMRASE